MQVSSSYSGCHELLLVCSSYSPMNSQREGQWTVTYSSCSPSPSLYKCWVKNNSCLTDRVTISLGAFYASSNPPSSPWRSMFLLIFTQKWSVSSEIRTQTQDVSPPKSKLPPIRMGGWCRAGCCTLTFYCCLDEIYAHRWMLLLPPCPIEICTV